MRRAVTLVLGGLGLLQGCPTGGTGGGTGGRADSRAVISGQVRLRAEVDGANDYSRVRVDLGRGEGGVPVQNDGTFTFSDLEPDTYSLAITYTGGLEDSASGSAYAPFATRVVASAGGSVSVGVIDLPLGRGTVRGSFSRGDQGSLSGLIIKLEGSEGLPELASTDGSFEFTNVPVGRYRLFAQRSGVAGVCGAEVVLAAHEQVKELPAQTLASLAVGLSPANASQVHVTDGTRWFLTGNAVTVGVDRQGAAQVRFWKEGETPGAFVTAGNTLDVTGVTANAETRVHFQFMDACGQETPEQVLTLVSDTIPPLVRAVLNNGGLYASQPTMLLEVDAFDALSEPLQVQRSLCNDGACSPTDLATAPWEPLLPLDEVTFTDVDGTKTVKLRVKDRSENTVDVQAAVVLSSNLDRNPPSSVVITVRDSVTAGGTTTVFNRRVRLEVTAVGATQARVGLSSTLSDGLWTGFVSPTVFEQDLGIDDGSATVFVQLRDDAGNATQIFPVALQLSNRGGIGGTVQLEGLSSHEGTSVIVLGTVHSATTAADGTFNIPNVEAGVYNVEFRAAGYTTQRVFNVPVVPPDTVSIPTIILAAVRGRIAGQVSLQGQLNHAGIEAVLTLEDGSTRTSVSDGAGYFVFAVAPGTYNRGIETRVPADQPQRYLPATFNQTITVLEDQVFNLGTLNMTAVANDITGVVAIEAGTLPADVSQTVISVAGETGTATDGVTRSTTADVNGSFTVTALPFGQYRVTYRNLSVMGLETRQLGAVAVNVGPVTVLPLVTLRRRFVSINNDAAATNNSTVTLSLSRGPDCQDVEISNSATFSPSTREACTETRTGWALATGQGVRTVYARFYTIDSPTIPTPAVSDEITVDSVAAISAFTNSPAGSASSRLALGTPVVFTATTGEPGTVTVSIQNYANGLVLKDDGISPDTTAGDGVYTLRYVLDTVADVNNARVDATFRDLAGNTATRQGTSMHIGVPPIITSVRTAVDTSAPSVTFSFVTNEPATGTVRYGTDTSYTGGTLATPSGTNHSVVLPAGPLNPGAVYHYVVEATDAAGNRSSTVDRVFALRAGSPRFPAAMAGDGVVHVRWEAPPQGGIAGYNIYRGLTADGPWTQLNSTPYLHEALLYADRTVTNDVTYFYQVAPVDSTMAEGDLSEVVSATPGTSTGPTNVDVVLRGFNVFSRTGSPYIVSADTTLETGGALIIGPGVEVHFAAPADNYAARVGMLIHGRLAILGDDPPAPDAGGDPSEGMVVLRSADPNGGNDRWRGILVSTFTPEGHVDTHRNAGIYESGTIIYRTRVTQGGMRSGFSSSATPAQGVIETAGPTGTTVGSGLYVARSTFTNLSAYSVINSDDSELVIRDCSFSNLRGVPFDISGSLALIDRITVTDAGGAGSLAVSRVGTGPWRDAYGLIRDSSWDRFGGPLFLGYGHAVDVVLRNATGNNAVSGGTFNPGSNNESFYAGSIARSTIDTAERASSVFFTSHCTIRNISEEALSNVYAFGNDIIDTGCAPPTTCGSTSPVDIAISSNREALANTITETSPHGRSMAIRMDYSSGILRARYNHVNLPLTGYPMIGLRGGAVGAQGNYNSLLFDVAAGTILANTTLNYSVNSQGQPNRSDLSGNFWGAIPNADMVSLPRDPLPWFTDYWDNTARAEIAYDPPAATAYPMPRITSPYWGERFYEGDTITFTGFANDPETGPIAPSSLRWVTESGTELGTGNTVTSSVFTAHHPAGNPLPPPRRKTYNVSLQATDPSGQMAEVPVLIEIWP